MSKRKRDAPPNARKVSGASNAPRPRNEPATLDTPEVGSDDQVQKTLDDALADSFPASDPVSIVTSQHEEAWRKTDEHGEKREHGGKRENRGKREHEDPPEAGSRR